jgi:hypothetical protein
LPALLVLAAVAARELAGRHGAWPAARFVLVAIVFACSIATNAIAYRELRGTKQLYAGIVAAARTQIPEKSYVITNVWWFDQVTAALYERHTVLFAPGPRAAKRLVLRLQAAGAPPLTFVESTEESPWLTLAATTEGSCYTASPPRRIPQRSVVFTAARCKAHAVGEDAAATPRSGEPE